MSDGANAAGEEYKVLCIGLGTGKGRRQYSCALAFGIATRMKESMSVWRSKVTLHETSAGSGEIGTCITGTHVPLPVQAFGGMLARRTKNRIQSREGK